MPSGLTCSIYDGSDMTLRGFALTCVRQLGAGYVVTDQGEKRMPLYKAPELEVSDYHPKHMKQCEEDLAYWKKVKDDPELCKRLYDEAHMKREIENTQSKDNKEEIKARYMKMIEKVESRELDEKYASLKELMLEQLHESMDWDCKPTLPNEAPMPSVEDWVNSRIELAEWRINYHKEEWEKEKQRVADTNAYLKGLYDAIDEFEQKNKD